MAGHRARTTSKGSAHKKPHKSKHTKTARILKRIGGELKGETFKGGEPQRRAILLSKARKAGARIPKPPEKSSHKLAVANRKRKQ